jgi:hypothetical protein
MPYTFLLLLVVFAATYRQPHGLTVPEAHQLWIVQDAEPLAVGQFFQPRVIAKVLLENTRQMLSRALDDGQPPAYAILLDGWTLAVGDSLVTVRLLSMFFVLLAIALLSVILRQLLRDHPHGQVLAFWLTMVAALLPATITLARSADTGATLLLASTLNLYLLRRWIKEPSVGRSLLYALSLAVALYIHLFAVLLIAFAGMVQAARLLQGQRIRSSLSIDWERLWVRSFTFGIVRWLLSAALALLLFFPFFLWAEPPTTITGGGTALWGLTLPWLVAYVGVAIARRLPVQQLSTNARGLATIGLLLAMSATYVSITPPVSDWNNVIAQVTQSRQPLEPMIIGYAPDSPPAYYADRTTLRNGIALDVGWREFTEAEHQALLDKLDPAQHIWLLMPIDSPAYSIWTAMLESQGRTRTARTGVDGFSVEQWSSAPES